MKKISFMLLFLLIPLASQAAEVTIERNEDGWRLLVDGEPFLVKGVSYNPVKVGEHPAHKTLRDWMLVDDDDNQLNDFAYQSWVDKNGNNIQDHDEPEIGDFQLLKNMGYNTIRQYHHASNNPELQKLMPNNPTFNHAPNKTLYRELHERYGIWVAMGDLLGAYTIGSGANWADGTDYTDPQQRRHMLASVRDMVMEFKDEPYILMWIIGNENNLTQYTKNNSKEHPEAYARFVHEVTDMIHQLDPKHPVCLCNGEVHLLSYFRQHAANIDILGLNSYRKYSFSTLWQDVATQLDKPVLITEFGVLNPEPNKEDYQTDIHKAAWQDIEKHSYGGQKPRNALGGFAFRWVDRWNFGKPDYHGITSQGDGRQSPTFRQLRPVYAMYQDLWNGKK